MVALTEEPGAGADRHRGGVQHIQRHVSRQAGGWCPVRGRFCTSGLVGLTIKAGGVLSVGSLERVCGKDNRRGHKPWTRQQTTMTTTTMTTTTTTTDDNTDDDDNRTMTTTDNDDNNNRQKNDNRRQQQQTMTTTGSSSSNLRGRGHPLLGGISSAPLPPSLAGLQGCVCVCWTGPVKCVLSSRCLTTR